MSYPPPPQPYYAPPPNHPKATTALVLGIVSIACCQLAGPFAWSIGKNTVAEIDAAQGRLGGRTEAQIGMVIGIISTVLLVLSVIGGLLYLVGVLVYFRTG